MDRIHSAVEVIARLMVWISGLALLATALLVSVDVVSRKWLGATLAGSDEISGYVLAISSSWALSYCLLGRAHVRIDLLYGRAALRLRCLFDLLALLALLLFTSILTYRAAGVLEQSFQYGAVSNTSLTVPQWIPQSLWVAGLAFFAVTLLVLTWRAGRLFARQRYDEVQRIAGIPSVADEIRGATFADPAPPTDRTGRPPWRR